MASAGAQVATCAPALFQHNDFPLFLQDVFPFKLTSAFRVRTIGAFTLFRRTRA